MAKVEIYCDGSSRPISEVIQAGYGVYVDARDFPEIGEIYISCGIGSNKTNDVAELMALISALRWKNENLPTEKVEIFSDSRYVVDSYNKYLTKWSLNGYKKVSGDVIANIELIKEMEALKNKVGKTVKVTHCYGHTGIHGNEIADGLANNGAVRSSQHVFEPHVKVVRAEEKVEKQKVKVSLNPFIYVKRLLTSLYSPLNKIKIRESEYDVFYGSTYSDDKEDNDRYFGKPATDAFYVVGFTKRNDTSVDAMVDYIQSLPKGRYDYSLLLNYVSMSMPSSRTLLASDGKDAIVSDGDTYRLLTEDKVLARVLIKPLLSIFAKKYFSDMESILYNYINGSCADFSVIKLNSLFVPSKKNFTLDPSIKVNDKKLSVAYMDKTIDLHFGFDIPIIQSLKKMAKEAKDKCEATLLVLVFKGESSSGKESLITTHYLVMEFDDNYIIHHSPHFSLRPY